MLLPDQALLLRHVWVLSGRPSQEAGGAPPLGTANAHKVARSHHVSWRVSRNLVRDHGVWANLLEDLWEPISPSQATRACFIWPEVLFRFLLQARTDPGPLTCAWAVASASDLDLFDGGIPFPHLLHVPHQFLVEAVRMLLQYDLQLEDLPDVR